ncbi:MAG: pitrilysin family protein [Pseudomonadota bacterium]
MIIKRLLLVFLFFFSSTFSSLHAQLGSCHSVTQQQLTSLENLPVHQWTLDNGLRVVFLHSQLAPTVAVRMVYDVAARDEKKGQSGYAHLFEHLMFKGSKSVPDGGHFHAIQSIGGRANATTDYDRTDYWNLVSEAHLERALWLEAERLSNLTFTQEKLDNQIQAVLEEKKLRLDNIPYFRVVSEFMVEQWRGTPYDHLIIGTEEELVSATLKDVQTFYQTHYAPNNAVLAVVGNYSLDKVQSLINKHFGKLKPAQLPKKPTNWEVSRQTIDAKLHDPLAPFPLYGIAWHTIGHSHPDYYAVEIFSDILIKHKASRLKRLLKEEHALVFETIGLPLTFRDVGLANLAFVPRSFTTFKELQRIVRQQIDDIAVNGVTAQELCRAIKSRQLQAVQSLRTHLARAQAISDGWLFHDNPQHTIAAIRAYAQVDSQKLQQIAKKYFQQNWITIEVQSNWPIQWAKWTLEKLPRSWSETIEKWALQ